MPQVLQNKILKNHCTNDNNEYLSSCALTALCLFVQIVWGEGVGRRGLDGGWGAKYLCLWCHDSLMHICAYRGINN